MDGELLAQYAAGYEPMQTAGPQYAPAMLPHMQVMDGLGMGPLPQMGMTIAAQSFIGGQGMNMMGVGHGMNAADAMRQQDLFLAQQRMMEQQRGIEKESYMRTAMGMANLANVPFGFQQQRAMTPMLDFASGAAPFLAPMFGDTMDQMAGMYGSPTVMAMRVGQASQYRFDPVDQSYGMSADSSAQLNQQLFRQMFQHGGLGERGGLQAGAMGSLFGELGRFGLLPGGDMRQQTLNSMDPTKLNAAASAAGISLPSDLRSLGGDQLNKLFSSSEMQGELRQTNLGETKRVLGDYADAIAAMRELMGTKGDPNAPIPRLMKEMNAMTQGGMFQMDAGQIAQTVRMNNQLSQMTGYSTDTMMMMQQHAAGQLSSAGVSPLMAPGIAQSSTAWGAALRGTGLTPTWGLMSADQFQQLDINLRSNAADSVMANRMNAVMRIERSVGGFDEKSEAGKLAAAIRRGDADASHMSESQMMEALVGTNGLSEGDVRGFLSQTFANQEMGVEFGTANIVRRQQGKQVGNFLQDRARMLLTSQYREMGFSAEDAAKKAEAAAGDYVSSMRSMSQSDRADEGYRNRTIGEVISRHSGGAVGGVDADLMGEQLYGGLEQALRRSSYSAFESQQNVFVAGDKTVEGRQLQIEQQARMRARMQKATTGLGSDSLLRSAVTAVQSAGKDDNISSTIAKALGGYGDGDVGASLAAPMKAIAASEKRLNEIIREIGNASPERRAELEKEFETVSQNLEAGKEQAFAEMQSRGYNAKEVSLESKHIDEAQKALTLGRENLAAYGRSGASYDEWSASDSGKAYSRSVNNAQSSVEDTALRALSSAGGMAAAGPQALEAAKRLLSSNSELKSLADKYAGGDVARLLAGDVDKGTPESVVKKARSLYGSQQRDTEALRSGKGWGDANQAAASLKRLDGKDVSTADRAGIGTLNALDDAEKNKVRALTSSASSLKRELLDAGVSEEDAAKAAAGDSSVLDKYPNLPQRTKDRLKASMDSRADLVRNVEGIAAKHGLGMDDMNNAAGVLGRFDSIREREAAIAMGDTGAALGRMRDYLGDDVGNGDVDKAAADGKGRKWLDQTLGGLDAVSSALGTDAAKTQKELKTLLPAFTSAMDISDPDKRKAALAKIQSQYGLSDDKMKELSGGLSGLQGASYGKLLGDGLDSTEKSGILKGLLEEGPADTTRQRIDLAGTLRLVGPDSADINATGETGTTG